MLLSVTVMMTRERWTDERIDEAFDRVDGEIRELRVEMRRGFEQIDKRFEKVDGKFDAMQSEMNQRFDSIQRMMFIGFVTLFASIIGALFAV